MKRFLRVFAVAALLLTGTTTAASAATPVVPNAPIVTAPYGTCVNGTFTVTEPGRVDLPSVQNGRWLEYGPSATLANVTPGEYTFGFTTAEGNFTIPASPGGQSDYRLENGVAYYTVVMPSATPYACDQPTPVYKPTFYSASWQCVKGKYLDSWGRIYAPAWNGHWKSNGSFAPTMYNFSPAASQTLTYTFYPNEGYYATGQTTYTFTITPAVKPVCKK